MEIPFPTSTAPSLNPTENGGRLINCYAEKAPAGSRSKVLYRRAPGLRPYFSVGSDLYRGSLLVGSILYIVNGATAYTAALTGGTIVTTALAGTVPGIGPVLMAHNTRIPTNQILLVHSDGVATIEGNTVSEFSDPDLPAVSSLTYLDGFFVLTSADGRAYASGVNDTTFATFDYATAEAAPDGLVRAVAFGRDLLLMGETTVELWSNTGNPEAFPFTRGPVIPVGLKGPYAVGGFEYGFPQPLCWVGSDNRVYRLVGYSPEPISTPQLERMIEAVADPLAIEGSVYVTAGHACFVLTSPSWTWVYDFITGEWHERQSYGASRWRAHGGVYAFGAWLTFDRVSNTVFQVHDRERRENGQPLVMELRSNQVHRLPGRFVVNRASFDFVTGVGRDQGQAPIETDPKVSISWSDDGGRIFGNALLRRLGSQGEIVPIDIFRCGLTGRNGRQWRLQISDPVEVVFLGGAMDIEERTA